MKEIAAFDLLAVLIRWGLGGAFVYAGITKALDPSALAAIISDYGLLPEPLLSPAAFFLIALEIIAGLGLIVGQAWALHAITAMLVVFIAVLAYGLWIGLEVDCGCFGPSDPEGEHHTNALSAIYRDLAMLLGVAVLYFQRLKLKNRSKEE